MTAKRCYLFQPQYGNNNTYWLPYTIGCLWAHAMHVPNILDNWALSDLYFKREPIEKLLDDLIDPALCGFSLYVWNRNYCLKAAQAIKEKWPNCIILFGGPSVTEKTTEYNFIDSVILKEGEHSFVDALLDYPNVKKIYRSPRINNLEDLPSPYTTGLFDKIVEKYPNYKWQTVIETNRGCPYQCTFCDWGGLTANKMKKFSLQRVFDEIDWCDRNGNVEFLYIADSNFGIFKKRDIEISKKIFKMNNKPEYVYTNFTKNSNETVFEIQQHLGSCAGITFSMQSMNPATLKAIKRENMESNNIQKLFKMSFEKKINYYVELILGLPEETKESWIDGICKLLDYGMDNYFVVYNAAIIENTELAEVQAQQYEIKTVKRKAYLMGIDDVISEYDEIVRETKHMSQEDIVDSFMFSWIIINFHTVGYSKFLVKYCIKQFKISNRNFYEALEKNLINFPNLYAIYYSVRTEYNHMLTYGKPKNDLLLTYDLLISHKIEISNHIDDINFLLRETVKQFGNMSETIFSYQDKFIKNIKF